MATQVSGERYDATARWLHWITVVLVVILVVTGKAGIEAEHPADQGFFWHSSLGIVVALVAAARIFWALVHPGPPLPGTMTRASRLLARSTHVALYLLLFALPLSGWLASSAAGAQVSVFGVVSLPSWQVPALQPAASQPHASATQPSSAEGTDAEGEAEQPMSELHETLGNILLFVAGLHILAALAHRFYWRDGLFERMLPARTK